jgi:hypothetical protein
MKAWLEKFQTRHKMSFKEVVCVELVSVNNEMYKTGFKKFHR